MLSKTILSEEVIIPPILYLDRLIFLPLIVDNLFEYASSLTNFDMLNKYEQPKKTAM